MVTRRSFTTTLAAFASLFVGLGGLPASVFAGGRQGRRLCRGEPQERARQYQRCLEGRDGQGSNDLLRRELSARQADRGRRTGRHFHLRRSAMDELSDRKEAREAGQRRRTPGQQDRPDRAKDSKVETTIAPDFPLAKLLDGGKLAMADVKAVPAGKYGKAALESLGVWKSVEGQVAQAENVRAALKLVATGEAPLGIVYQTDAHAEPAVKVIGTFPANTHEPIVYPIGLTTSSTNPDAAEFAKFVQTAPARKLFEEQGFTVLLAPITN